MASQAMDKANAAVDQLVKTTKELRETRAELSATIDELRMTKLDLGKTKEALESTSAELAKTKKELKASSERVFRVGGTGGARLGGARVGDGEFDGDDKEPRRGTRGTTHRGGGEERVSHAQEQTPGGGGDGGGRVGGRAGRFADGEGWTRAANATAAQAKIRLGLLRRERGEREANRPAKDEPQPYVSDARIMDGTPEDLVPYQKTLTDEYHKASVALKREAAKRA